jgi:hypothetical protein
MNTRREARKAKKNKERRENNKSKILKIRELTRREEKAKKETAKLQREVEKIQNRGMNFRKDRCSQPVQDQT